MKNEKGITLIEVLATLSILIIISSIIYSVFFGVNKNYSQLSGKNNLGQESNLIISTIKSYHLRNNSYRISYDPSTKTYYIGQSSASNQLGSTNLVLLKIDDVAIPTKPNEKVIDITSSKSISVYIELKNQHGEYKFDTIIKRY